VSEAQLEEMGPIDYVVLEWQGELPTAGRCSRSFWISWTAASSASSTSRS
jgi:hypothetical protein